MLTRISNALRKTCGRLWVLFGFALLTVLLNPYQVASQTLPNGFAQARIAHAFQRTTAMAVAPDGRVFVAEAGGKLRVIKNDSLLPTPFLTVTTDISGERGLVGVAVDPNFSTNGYVYVYYTATTPSVHNRLSRFTANGDVAVAGSEVILLELDDLTAYDQHNGGALQFGLDGKLYVSVGDNQNGANAQSMSTLKGKVLRLNSNGTIPTDNPFYASAVGNNRAIWALGFRNPFTMTVQPGTGRLFINDVGQDSWEEINEGVSGGNFGWPYFEGYSGDPAYESPFYVYSHGSSGCDSITGGAFYNPSTPQFPSEYEGKYFFMELCQGWIKTLDPVTMEVADFASGLTTYIAYATVSPDGSLYYLSVGEPDGFGSLYRIRYTGSLAPSVGTQPADQLVSVGYSAEFGVSASGYQPLSYQWQKNGVNIPGATASVYTTPAAAMSDNGAQFRCVVTNQFGTATSNAAFMSVTTDQPPVGNITSPAEGTLYNAGDTIFYSATATDPETGNLPGSAYTWQVDFGHDTHFHPYIAPVSGASNGSFLAPTSGEGSAQTFFRVWLTVTDSAGLKHRSFRDVTPRTTTVTVTTNQPGLLVTVNGQPHVSPYSFETVVNFTHSIGVYTPQTVGGVTYSFQSWSDGGAATHNISGPATNSTYTATFVNAREGTISASPNPIQVCDGTGTGITNLTWTTSGVTSVEVRLNSPSGTLFASTPVGTHTRTTGKWVNNGMVFYLQDTSGGAPLTAANTLATVIVNVNSSGCTAPSGTISASPNPIQVCDGSGFGITTVSWSSANVSAVEVHVNAPDGARFASWGAGSSSATTGKWVGNGTKFYLQNVSGGLPLTAANTLAVITVNLTNNGCRGGTLTANPNPIPVCDGSGLGITDLSWTSFGVSAIEVHIGSPSGSLFSRIGPSATKTTGKWVQDGMKFFLQDVSNGLPLTTTNTLATVTVSHTTAGCIAITQQPQNQTAGVGQNATFTVGASGAAPLSYQWRRNGVDIAGATSASYTRSQVSASDNGAQFSCVVTNPYSSATSSAALLSVTVNLTLNTSPAGLQITYDGAPKTGPSTVTGIIGSSHTLGAPSPQTLNGATWDFDSWSDGGAATHIITTPGANAVYTAVFRVRRGVIGTGTGLFGTYFDNVDLTGATVTRTDANIAFDWGLEAPIAGIAAGTYSVRWTGFVQSQVGERVTFYTQSSDGVRLWVNNKLLVDNWTNHSLTENSGAIVLKAGQKYAIRLEYYKNTGNAVMKLLWSSPSIPKSVVPKSQLYPQ